MAALRECRPTSAGEPPAGLDGGGSGSGQSMGEEGDSLPGSLASGPVVSESDE